MAEERLRESTAGLRDTIDFFLRLSEQEARLAWTIWDEAESIAGFDEAQRQRFRQAATQCSLRAEKFRSRAEALASLGGSATITPGSSAPDSDAGDAG